MHILRQRVPALSHAQIIEYVTALQHGDAPAHLVKVSSRELVPAYRPVLVRGHHSQSREPLRS
ncbi:hypothetical protein SAMN05216267_10723 [Actinacidiphila rubida]|uniref:Uncharacterized protein n=2 Tax=Actinacidiphila rubida TaxID=310780 RepID=A0A1H8UGL4_9ACTN|nr:hypothetical protein SAMN05216267_10723 [Actinacidiphila rubida]